MDAAQLSALQNRRQEREYKIAAYVGWTLLTLHFLTGIVYFCLIAAGRGGADRQFGV